jgi:hypothetical protein
MERGYYIVRIVTDNIRNKKTPVGIIAFNSEYSCANFVDQEITDAWPNTLNKKFLSRVNATVDAVRKHMQKDPTCKCLEKGLPDDASASGPFSMPNWNKHTDLKPIDVATSLFQGVVLGIE